MDKQLFGAVVASNLLELTEGKKWDAVKKATVTTGKFIKEKAPSIVKGTGIATNYVGKKIVHTGEKMHDIGNEIKTNKKFELTEPKDPTGNLTTTGKISHGLNMVRDSVSHGIGTVAKGVGSTVSAIGSVPEKVGAAIKTGGEEWQTTRTNEANAKTQAERQKVLDDEKEQIRKAEIKRQQRIRDAETDATVRYQNKLNT